MIKLVTRTLFHVKQLKNVANEDWIQKPEDASVKWADADVAHLNIKFYRDVKKQLKEDLNE